MVAVAVISLSPLGGAAETNRDVGSAARVEPYSNRGSLAHDPSTIVKCGGEYWLFCTGQGIGSLRSHDLVRWETGPRVFSTPPAWTTNVVPGFRAHFWAPDVIHIRNRYLLYYSVSSWGKNTSAIGLATNATLDPADPMYGWKDEGPVCQSGPGNDFNAIDPSVAQASDGTFWMAFGSFWSGIKLVQLDATTGKRIEAHEPPHGLAFQSSIEAPCIWPHGDSYYLFVNWGACCRGTNSTYNIRVGRATRITGPYLDKEGQDLLHEGGTRFLETQGALIGPGHAGIYSEGGTNWISCHFYDGTHAGAATLAVTTLQWDADGWPTCVLAPPK